jgi:dTDP-4-amino-4,6-dideoxygalactose transaminase
VEAFEREFARSAGVRHCVAVASGTDALWLSLSAAGVGPGDEVVTVSHTCVPTAAAILQCGATPVLADVDPVTMTMDPASAARAISRRTKALLPVHLYGLCADLAALKSLARAKGLPLIEDCAQAAGASFDGRPAGGHGLAGAFSFYPTKNLGALGDGGAITTDDASFAARLRRLRFYGYEKAQIARETGHNSRLDELQAAFLSAALVRLPAWIRARRDVAELYRDGFADLLACPDDAPRRRHAYHLFVVRSRRRESLRRGLAAKGVETAVHYPVPVHLQRGYAPVCRIGPTGLAVTERLSREIVSLPLYPELRSAEVKRVVAAVRDAA